MSTLARAWALASLGELVQIIRGVSYKKEDAANEQASGLIPILRATNINGSLTFHELVWVPEKYVNDEQMLQRGDIVIAASSGSASVVGKAAQLKQEWRGSFGAFCMGLRPVRSLNSAYVSFYLQTSEYRNLVSSLAKGVNINNLKRQHIEQIEVPLAPRFEQDRIVAEIEKQFTRLDDAVAALKRVQANLKRYRASVLKAACEGRLVPTEAELARKEGRDYESASELLKRILAERRAKWEADQLQKMVAAGKPPRNDDWKEKYQEPEQPGTADLPQLPKGWTWATVGQVSWRVQYGSSAKCCEVGDVPVLRMGNLTSDGRLFTDQLKYLPKRHEEFPELLLQKNDLIFNRTNSAELVGKTAVYHGSPAPCSFASYLIRAPLLEGCTPNYLAAVLNSVLGRNWIKSVVNQQVGQANVNGSKLQAFVFPLPPFAEQHRIVKELSAVFDSSFRAEESTGHELARAERMRQSLLAQAFSGKLVPQDPNDEPASVLLERIRAERVQAENRKTPKATNGASPARGQRRRRVAKLARGVSPGKG